MTLADWQCVTCKGLPAFEPNQTVVEGFATGVCSNIVCPSKADKGSKRAPIRPPGQATFRRVHAKAP